MENFIFFVGIFLSIAALVIFLINPELPALIIPLAFFGGVSLLVGFLWNTIKSWLPQPNSEKISTEPLSETNRYGPNKITDLIDPKNNSLSRNGTANQNKQGRTEPK